MKGIFVFFIVVSTFMALMPVVSTQAQTDESLVSSIDKAPIVADGDVAGRVTDFVITLNTSLDPAVEGRTLLEGNTIKVTLPDDFVNDESVPLTNVGTTETCAPPIIQCNFGVLLQGWPQRPIAPPKYSLSYEGTNTIVYTALEDLTPNAPTAPGIKQMHLILTSFTNPGAGTYEIEVETETGPNGAVEQGIGLLKIRPEIAPSINPTSVFNEGNPNAIYQEAVAGEQAPYPFDYLLWDEDGMPMEGVTIRSVSPTRSELVQGDSVVGQVFIQAPTGADGQGVFTEEPSFQINSPVSGFPTARLQVFFQAGSEAGEYVVTFTLNGGNSAERIINVTPAPAPSSSAPSTTVTAPSVGGYAPATGTLLTVALFGMGIVALGVLLLRRRKTYTRSF